MKLDPVDYAVISQSVLAAAREMGAKLIRSAYSTIVREAEDASAALLDRNGNVVAQAELIPIQLGAISAAFAPCIERHPVDTLEEGDFLINNDPFQGGQHVPDVFIFSPVFYAGRVIAFSATCAHHLDFGGGNPGLNATASDVFQEGLIIPPAKYNYERDWNGGNFERMVAANIRVPALTIGDFNSQFAANAIGAARISQLCDKYGPNLVEATLEALNAYSERRVRNAIRDLPDGVYCGEDAVDDDGLSDEPLAVKASVRISGEDMEIDFEGTCPQVTRNLNAPFASTISAALSCVKSALTSADIPFNEGAKRPITIKAPFGSLLNPRPPAPVRARLEASYRAYNAVMKALSQVVPEQVIATGFDTTTALSISHLGPDGYRVYIEIFGGGYGASAHGDGCDAIDSPLSNCRNMPVEALDMEYPYFRVTDYGMTPDSCGHGTYRGGVGFYRRYEILEDDVNFAIYADRFRIEPEGLFGGTNGTCGRCEVERDGEIIRVHSKDGLMLRKGDLLTLYTGGGAGYGDVAHRDRSLIRADVRSGLITPTEAERVYGVTGSTGTQ